MSKKFFLLVIGGFGLVLVAVLASVGGFAFLSGSPAANQPAVNIGSQPPAPPPAPQISLTIRKLTTGNSLIIQWTNLPATTAALDLFCSSLLKPEPSSSWTLWKEILLSSGELAAGDREVALGVWYQRCSFYVVQAVTAKKVGTLAIGATTTLDFASGVNGSGGSDDGSTILWTSGITKPGVTTSTVGLPPPPPPPPPPSTGVQNSSSSNQTPSSTNPGGTPPQPTSTPSSTTPIGGVPPNTPSGTPYYNPKVEVYGYAASGSPIFWVQHAGQGIEIGWQNIPPQTDTIIILRSSTQDGPWTAFLTERNLPTNNFSLQVVDSAVSTPYYYQMQALSGSSSVALYGPNYLAP